MPRWGRQRSGAEFFSPWPGLHGSDDPHKDTFAADGVALAAIQGLNHRVDERIQNAEQAIRELRAGDTELRKTVNALKSLMQAMNKQLKGGNQ